MPWFKRHAKQQSSSGGDEQESFAQGDNQEQSAPVEGNPEQGNSVVVGPGQGSTHGTEEVLLTIPNAIAHLVDGNESAHLATGPFSLVRLSQDGNGIAVFAKVGDDLQWPLLKDVPTAKLDETHYFFTLRVPPEVENDTEDSAEDAQEDGPNAQEDGPSTLSYGITFENGSKQSLFAKLDKLLEQYSYFSLPQVVQGAPERKAELDHAVKEKGKGRLDRLEELIFGKPNPPAKPTTIPADAKRTATRGAVSNPAENKQLSEDKSSAYWTTLAPSVEDYSTGMAKGIASQSNTLFKGLFWCSDATIQQLERLGDYAKMHITPNEKPTRISPRTLRNLRRVKKMSRMTDRIAKGVLAGVITATGLASGTLLRSRAGRKFFGMLPGEVALVSLDVFGKVFDAVEIAGRSVLTSTRVITCGVVSHRYGEQAAEAAHEGLSTAGHVFSTAWTMTKLRKALNPNRAGGAKFSKKAVLKSVIKGKQPAPAS